MLKLTAIGFLGKDAESKAVNNKTVINFSVAHTEKFTSNGQPTEKTIWLECAYWTDKAGILPYLKKGTQVYIEGSPEVRTYESNGKAGASLTVRIMSVQLLGSKDSGQQANTQQTAAPAQQSTAKVQQTSVPNDDNDDLPF